jgi:CDK inhibitor PHO81
LPVEGFDVHVGESTLAQFLALAERTGKKLDVTKVVDKADPAAWYQAIAGALVPLDELLKVRSADLHSFSHVLRMGG